MTIPQNQHPAVWRLLAVTALLWLSPSQWGNGIAADGVADMTGVVKPVGTQLLKEDDDFASRMVDGIDRFLTRKTEQANEKLAQRSDRYPRDPQAFKATIEKRREQLKAIIGMVDRRCVDTAPLAMAISSEHGLVAQSESLKVYAIRWPAIADPTPGNETLTSVWGEGLLLVPKSKIIANVVAVPDADQSPEVLCTLKPGLDLATSFPLRLAHAGCRVVVPFVTSRQQQLRADRALLTDREYLHRSAFVLGRTLAGYEVQKILSAIDWLCDFDDELPIGVIGYGEGGYLVTLAAALDQRIVTTGISGFFGSRSSMWQEPLDRNLNGFLQQFDAPDLGLMILPRSLVIEAGGGPDVEISSRGAAPGKLTRIDPGDTTRSVETLRAIAADRAEALGESPLIELVVPTIPSTPNSTTAANGLASANVTEPFVDRFLLALRAENSTASVPQSANSQLQATESGSQRQQRQTMRRSRQLAEMDRHNQLLWRESSFTRQQYFEDLDRDNLQTFSKTIEPYRDRFRKDVIGQFNDTLMAPHPRMRKRWEGESWIGYEIVLDVFPDVFAYAALLLPRDLTQGERRPVVVCQHGLEGRPTDTFWGSHRAYHNYAASLCEQGYIVVAPQNPYIFGDRFRTLQRKAQPLGCSLFSVIVPQHQQLVNWLKSQPFVDPQRIAFYGLSYGGKSAMRIPALVTDYCLSICSADFNEWVLKNASTRDLFSYVWTGEYEIFEWNLGGTFNYAEMAALICPRPFMVERGHFDGVATDEWVAFEYAKVRHLYAAQLGIPDQTEIEWFAGPHTIHGQGTFAFLRKHLNWPESP